MLSLSAAIGFSGTGAFLPLVGTLDLRVMLDGGAAVLCSSAFSCFLGALEPATAVIIGARQAEGTVTVTAARPPPEQLRRAAEVYSSSC